jgi:hypothetical protein
VSLVEAARQRAQEFADEHVLELAKDLVGWATHPQGILPTECKLRELQSLCKPLDVHASLRIAENFAHRAIAQAFVASKA